MQRAPLLAITSAYKTASTNCLKAVAGELPLDLRIREWVPKKRLKSGECTPEDYTATKLTLLDEWQDRYSASEKAEWTRFMIPSVVTRFHLPLELDHYTSLFLTGHGDFRAKLHSFKLVNTPTCKCSLGGSETVAHVLLRYKRTEPFREHLKRTIENKGENWPPVTGVFMKSRTIYEALRRFAAKALKNRTYRL